MDINMAEIAPQHLQQTYLDFKKVVDKYFAEGTYAEGVFDSSDMAAAIEEMATVSEKFGRIVKEHNESNRSTPDGI